MDISHKFHFLFQISKFLLYQSIISNLYMCIKFIFLFSILKKGIKYECHISIIHIHTNKGRPSLWDFQDYFSTQYLHPNCGPQQQGSEVQTDRFPYLALVYYNLYAGLLCATGLHTVALQFMISHETIHRGRRAGQGMGIVWVGLLSI